jgi:hypothetical protein
MDIPNAPEDFDEIDPMQQYQLFNELFMKLYSVDSTRVMDLGDDLETSVIYLIDPKRLK